MISFHLKGLTLCVIQYERDGGKTDVYKMLTSSQKFERPVALKATGRSNFCIEVGDVEEC